jgi:hypothetical protein
MVCEISGESFCLRSCSKDCFCDRFVPPQADPNAGEALTGSAGPGSVTGSDLLLSPVGGAGGGELASGGASGAEAEEEDDGYTPLDPAYLPPGLEDEESKENLDVRPRLIEINIAYQYHQL